MAVSLSQRISGAKVRTALDVLSSVAVVAAAIVFIWRGVGESRGASPNRPDGAGVEDLKSAGLSTSLSDVHVRGNVGAPLY